MVNTAFALKFTTPCKLASKCGIYHLCFWFPPSLHFFTPYLHRVNLSKSNFSCSVCFRLFFFFSITILLFILYENFKKKCPERRALILSEYIRMCSCLLDIPKILLKGNLFNMSAVKRSINWKYWDLHFNLQ